MPGSVGGFLGQLVAGVAVVTFVVGLMVRLVQWVRGKSSRRRHSQSSGEWAGRAFADEVPVHRPGTRRSRSQSRRRR